MKRKKRKKSIGRKIIKNDLTCMYCLKKMKLKDVFHACKCKGSHIAHKKCIIEFIKRNNSSCSVCNTEYNIKYNIPTDFEIYQILISEYYQNFSRITLNVLSNLMYLIKHTYMILISASKFFILYGVPFLAKASFCIGILYANLRFNSYLISRFFQDVITNNILSVCGLTINYSIINWLLNIGKNISRRKKAILRRKRKEFEIFPYQEDGIII